MAAEVKESMDGENSFFPITSFSNFPVKIFPSPCPKFPLKDCSAAALFSWADSRIKRISSMGVVVANS